MRYIDPIFAADFYKTGHKDMYPEGTEVIYSNFTARSNRLCSYKPEHIVVFGIQGFIQEWLIDAWNEGFFQQPKAKVLAKYVRRMQTSIGGEVDTQHISDLHDLGFLPVEIKALPEGSLANIKVPVLTIKNTLPGFFWVTNYLETLLSNELWKPMTTATTAFEYKKLLTKYAKETGSALDFVLWQGHDFSLRGLSNMHDSASAAGHLVSFLGTDTIPAIDYLEAYYDGEKTFVGGSVPASEHSVICAGGSDNELETIRRLITKVNPTGVVSVVSDTWDFFNVITNTAAALKQEILDRKPNALGLAKVVFRPDSGDPVEILCGIAVRDYSDAASLEDATIWAKEELVDQVSLETDHGERGEDSPTSYFRYKDQVYKLKVYIEWNRYDKQYYFMDGSQVVSVEAIELTPEQKGAVECLWDTFGGTMTSEGYRVLNERVGLIYGDSITLERAEQILQRLKDKGFASSNVVFGIGSYTYQYVTRDTFGFAMKATYAQVNGVGRELFKDPKTDSGVKKSAKGLLRVEETEDGYELFDQQTLDQEQSGSLVTVFKDGVAYNKTSLEEIRNRLKSQYSLV